MYTTPLSTQPKTGPKNLSAISNEPSTHEQRHQDHGALNIKKHSNASSLPIQGTARCNRRSLQRNIEYKIAGPERKNIDMAPAPTEKMYLVIVHKVKNPEERAIVPNGTGILDGEQLVTAISANPDIVMIHKAIKPGCTSFDILKADLVPEDKKAAYEKAKKENAKGAMEEVPWKEFLGHNWEGHSFDEVTLLVGEEAVAKVLKGVGMGESGEAAEA